MKKLLSLLATVSLVSTSTASIVACGNGNNGPIDDNDGYEEKDISTIINNLDLGEIIFNSLDGSDSETQNAISEQIRTLNPNVDDAQINIININRINSFATISIQGYTGTVTVSFIAITHINAVITYTDLGEINFYSLTGNDTQTQTEIINKVRTLNPNVGTTQINISNINQANGTATISVVGFSESLTVTFTVLVEAEAEPISISFSSIPRSMIELQDGTILVAGGVGATSFLASVDLSNSQTQTLAQGSAVFPSAAPHSIIELQDGTVLVAGGTTTANSFLASVDLSDPDNPQIQILAQGPAAFPSVLQSIIELQDGTILVIGGTNAATSFLASVDLSNPTNPQTQILTQGSFPAFPHSIIELEDGTILIVGGTTALSPFLASVDLSDPDNPQTQTLAQGPAVFPAILQSITQLQDGTILIIGGTNANGSNAFLALVDLSNSNNPVQILAQGSDTFPSAPNSITQLDDGTILVVGGTVTDGSDSFIRLI